MKNAFFIFKNLISLMKSSVVTSYFEMMISAADSCIAAVFVVQAFDPVSVEALTVLGVEHLIVGEYFH